jgi:antitoxin MazE
MRTQVQKWGNSLALRIPRSFAVEAGIARETPVTLTLEDGRLVITAVETPRPTLRQLLGKVTLDNLHGEVDYGPAAGRESW